MSNIRVTVLIKTVRDEFNSVTYVVRNMANDTFDQKFGNHNKNHFQNATIENFGLAFQLVLKVVAFCLDTDMKASAPLLDCSIDDGLVQFFPRCFDALAQLINVFNSALINLTTALRGTPTENALLYNVWFLLEILSQVYLSS